MIRIFIPKLFVLVALFVMIHTNGQDVSFTELKSSSDWEKAINTAKTGGKKVFLDIYATWCGPCKMMDAKVYTDSVVAGYFNSNFINVKVDGESEFGMTLVRQYNLTAYPSMYFINGDKQLVFTIVGYREPTALISLADVVLKHGERYMALSSRFDEGQINPDERKEYLELLLSFGRQDRYQQVVVETLNNMTETDVLNPSNKTIIFNGGGDLDSKTVSTVIKNASEFRNTWGVDEFNKYLSGIFNTTMQNAIKDRNESKMERIAEVFIPVYLFATPERIIPTKLITRKIYYAETLNWDRYIKSVDDYYIEHGNVQPRFLLNEAYYIVENKITNDQMLAKALEWINKELVIQPGFETYFLGTIINAYRKDMTEANIWMTRAEPLAVSEEDKASLVQLKTFLEKIKNGEGGGIE